MVVLSFGSSFDLESTNKTYIESMQNISEYAAAKGVEMGGYDLLAHTRQRGHNASVECIGPDGQPDGSTCLASQVWYIIIYIYCTIDRCTILHCIILHCTTLYYTVLHYTTLCYTMLHYATLCYTTRYAIRYTALYSILHYTIKYCTALHCHTNPLLPYVVHHRDRTMCWGTSSSLWKGQS
jgi:hypothetical protein